MRTVPAGWSRKALSIATSCVMPSNSGAVCCKSCAPASMVATAGGVREQADVETLFRLPDTVAQRRWRHTQPFGCLRETARTCHHHKGVPLVQVFRRHY